MTATKKFFRSGFGYARFSDLEDFWDDLPTTSRKTSGLPGSLLTKSPFHNRSERFGFSNLEDFLDDLPVSRPKYNALDDFQEWTCWKSSDEVFFHIQWSSSLSL
ncbi:hypothetical protein F2Q69_00011481 [Brassica cretica]|uniref:Uncharacterized protein n=1 Tax=Brassica cretica TaxID=69181 RepID=A0A8S9QN85_BRACR|nr:hypothetical protein F2Q69_00011481 [Brassica cretica]